MRVLMVTSSYPKYPGDVTAPFVESIAVSVAARGHDVDVILPEHPDLRRRHDEPVRFFPFAYAPWPSWCQWGYAASLESDERVRTAVYLLAPLAALGLRRELGFRLRERRYDVVHVHWVVPNAALVADVLAAHGVPVVVSLHGSDVFLAERLAPARWLAARTFRTAGAVTACSGDLRTRALRLGAPAARTRTVPYGVDAELFAPRAASEDLRRRLGWETGALRVLALGRLVEKKGFRYLVEAAANVDAVRVAVAGDGDLRAALYGLAARVSAPVTLTGPLERADAAAALGDADVVVVPSVVDRSGNVDGLPNVLLEALAAGRAVVASRVAGIPDVVEDGVNGLLVPVKDAGALAAALRRLRDDPGLRGRLGAEARRRAAGSLSWQAAARAFEECYVQAATLDAR